MTLTVSKELYPFEHNYLTLKSGHKLHYIDEGDKTAPPVVMVHGNPSWSFYYRELVKVLREDYRVIVLDHIGCGFSDKPPEPDYNYTLEQRYEDLNQLIQSLDFTHKIRFVVHDWGGMIGSLWICRNLDRIERVAYLNTAAFHLPKSKAMPMSLLLARSWIGAFLVRGLNMFCTGAVKHCVTRRAMPKEVAAAYVAPYDNWSNRLAVHRFVQDIPLKQGDRGYELVSEVQQSLEKMKDIPKLIIWGDNDFVFDAHFLAEWRRLCPEAEVMQLSDAGHYVLEDAPEDVIPKVKEFFAKTDAPAAD